MMTEFEERKEARAERFRQYAANARQRAKDAYTRSRQATDGIPFGQPILIGHHSEGKHRNALKRSDNAMRRSVDESDKAAYWENRADAVENDKGGIRSDDPEAVAKLREKLSDMEASQARMKAANAIVRSNPRDEPTPEKLAKLQALGYALANAELTFKPDFCGRVGFPSYALANNNGNMRRVRERIKTLEHEHTREPDEDMTTESGIELRENTERMGLELVFPTDPGKAITKTLHDMGWRWARRSKLWYCRRSNGQRQFAERLIAELE